jgi:GNAT superfamily N-acetyltransferase
MLKEQFVNINLKDENYNIAKLSRLIYNDTCLPDFLAFVQEYLPGSELSKIKKRYTKFGEAFIMAIADSRVIGAAFGWPRSLDAQNDTSFTLDGIAVDVQYQKRGLGGRLLSEFEKTVSDYGFTKVSVGSAGGYAEHFYIKNGYMPVCYKYYGKDCIKTEKIFKDQREYEGYERKNPMGFIVFEKKLP